MDGKTIVTVAMPVVAAEKIGNDPEAFKAYMLESGFDIQEVSTSRHSGGHINTSNGPKTMRQIITITPDGNMFGMDHKRKGLDLRELGIAKTERVTLIEWEVSRQCWFIEWTDRVMYPVESWKQQTFADAKVSTDPWEVQFNSLALHEVVFFTHYEDAVAAEVAVIQAMQLAGDTVVNLSEKVG